MRPKYNIRLNMHILKYLGLISFTFVFCRLSGQEELKDFKDVIRGWKKDTIQKTEQQLKVGKAYFTLLPIVGYAPANGFLVGGAVSISKLNDTRSTNLSSALLNFSITSKSQIMLQAKTKIFLADNKWFFQGDWRFLIFTQDTYGLGVVYSEPIITRPGDDATPENAPPEAEMMSFDQIRFYEKAGVRLGQSSFYVGMGVAIDHQFKINDERLDTVASSATYYITKHYEYSTDKGFNPLKYSTHGLEFTVFTDTRDNISNTYKGYFGSFSVIQNLKISSNSQASTQLKYDARYYLGLNKQKEAQVLALWSWATFLLSGNVPYLALPAIGWDTYNRSGRGYIQGRFRGLNMMYNEAEYRYPITKNGLLGGTVFVNSTTASSSTQKLFDNSAFGIGAGIRLKMDKLTRTNLTVDYGIGADKSSFIYFNLQETF